MFYEGSEKRLEITSTLDLLQFEDLFWQEMVAEAGAHIISVIENNELKAFLLSESSLFVWQHRILLITCGETHLLQAALYFQNKVNRDALTSLLFQRHQPLQPERQKSNFQQDSLLLQQHLQGDSLHWRSDYCGDAFLFGNNQQPFATKNILMQHTLSGKLFDMLHQGHVSCEKVASALNLEDYFSHFRIDQHSFDPLGYSLNAINGSEYFTLHITPEKHCSYLSFESNLPLQAVHKFHDKLQKIFNAQRNYLMQFTPSDTRLQIETRRL